MTVKSKTAAEPLLTRATITAVVGLVVALLLHYGVNVSTETQATIVSVLVVVLPLVVAAVTRHKVTPVKPAPAAGQD